MSAAAMRILQRSRTVLHCSMAVLCLAAPALADELDVDGGSFAATNLEGPPEPPPDPNAPAVGASLDRSEVHVGDGLTLTVSAIGRDATVESVRLADPVKLGKFELLDRSSADVDLGNGKKNRRFVLQIAAYETGELDIPALSLEYRAPDGSAGHVETRAIAVRVVPVVDDPKAEMQPLRQSRDVIVHDDRLERTLWAAAIGLATLIVILVAVRITRRMRRRPAQVTVAPPRPPLEVALERLRAIRAREDHAADQYRAVHFEIAEVVRGHLGAELGFDSLELTSTELLERIARERPVTGPQAVSQPGATIAPLPEGVRESIRRYLDESDLIKFARAPSSEPAVREALDAAEGIVQTVTTAAREAERTPIAPAPVPAAVVESVSAPVVKPAIDPAIATREEPPPPTEAGHG